MSELYEIGKLIGIGQKIDDIDHLDRFINANTNTRKLRMMQLEQKDRDNIQNQLKLLQKLRHPNIVSYKDSYTDKDGNLCIVMTYCEAGDMYARIRSTKQKGKNFTQSQILDWIAQTSLAIHYLHHQKILHRDLKSQNLFMKKDQRIRLGDFGIAKVLDNAQDLTATCIGTPYYMSPQIFKYKSYSYKCDIWSFGVIIYEMCNMRLPFEAQSYNALAIKIIKGLYPSITPTYSKQLRDLITSMLSKKPQNRPTIIDIINKPFIRKRVEKYMNDLLNRNLALCDRDDIFMDSLREQAQSLNIILNEEEGIRRYPSSKDLQKKWNRNMLSRRGEEDDERIREKRKSLMEKQSISLEKNIKRRQQTASSSKALNTFDFKDEKEAFIDHKKKSMMDLQVKPQRKPYYEQSLKTKELNQQKYNQQQNIRRFRLQEDYSMSDQADDDVSIDQEIIREESDEDLTQLTTTNMNFDEEEQAPENYNKTYYKILDQVRVLKHVCETGMGTHKFIRAYTAVNNGSNREGMTQIVGEQMIGYWHLLDQILFYEGILKTLSKQ